MCHNNPLHIWRTKKQRCTLVWVDISFFGVKKHQRPTIIQFFGQKFLCFSPRRSKWESVVTCLSTTTFLMVLYKIVTNYVEICLEKLHIVGGKKHW